ncbi:MAG: hypothetical protein PHR99_01600, partial [Methanobacteriales archaeon]|nr:hypothetical protein [Methanobacteriales archaeon]
MRIPHPLIFKIISFSLAFLLFTPAYATSANQDVTVTVTEIIQIETLWNGKETTNPFTFIVYVGSWGEYYW